MREAFRRYAEWAGPQEWTTFRRKTARGNVCSASPCTTGTPGRSTRAALHGAPHGLPLFRRSPQINDPACRRAMPELWLCNGTGAQDALLAGHMPEDRTALVEALRYLYLAPKPRCRSRSETPAKPTRLLIVTSFFADETDAHLATLAASAKAGTLDGWEVVVKPHPYLPVVERLKNLYGGAEPPSVVDGPIGNFLTPGTVVWASNSTTVALEAAFRKLPVLVQAAEDDVDLCPLQGPPRRGQRPHGFRRGRRPRRSQGPRPAARLPRPRSRTSEMEGTVGPIAYEKGGVQSPFLFAQNGLPQTTYPFGTFRLFRRFLFKCNKMKQTGFFLDKG